MTTERAVRLDGLGIALLGLAAVMAMGFVLVGSVRTPAAPDDTGVQNSMAWAAWAMVWVSIVAGAIGAFSLLLIYWTLQATRKSANAAVATVEQTQRIGEAQTRAYLTVKSAALTIADSRLRVDYYFRNSGQTPALRVETFVRFTVDDLRDGKWVCAYRSHWIAKSRSDIPSQENREGHGTSGRLPVALLGALSLDARVVVEIRLRSLDVFDIERDKTVTYAVYLSTLMPNKHTLYRQISETGVDGDIFD